MSLQGMSTWCIDPGHEILQVLARALEHKSSESWDDDDYANWQRRPVGSLGQGETDEGIEILIRGL